jgi:hypothetical protein
MFVYRTITVSGIDELQAWLNEQGRENYRLHTLRHVVVPSSDDIPTTSTQYMAVVEGVAEDPKDPNAPPDAMAAKG